MSWTFHGLGQSWIMDTLVGSICSPLGDRMNLRYSTVSMWNLHFLRLAYSPAMHRRCKTSWTWSRWSCHGTTPLLSFLIFVCAPPHLCHLPTPSNLVRLPSATSTPTPRCTHATMLHLHLD